MADGRRYRDDEVRRIFALATTGDTAQPTALQPAEGLTLAELQDVGREVGLDPERVTRAAMALDAEGTVEPRGRTLGMPTSVGRVIDLPRDMADREWELLVSDLRATFRAKGIASMSGGIREWSNGNLHVFVEPTATGHRLRLTTTKGGVAEQLVASAFLVGFAGLLTTLLVAKGKTEAMALPAFFAIIGTGLFGTNLIRLPRWASQRERQMEHIANRVRALLASPKPDDDSR